ncbi:MAG TPA: hypothetical protein VNT56_00995 [Acidimicrobiales bacterium]|jgi:hypothetical protein|nr:hypothetical protein [Acidimicrobiales bacterium]
MRKVVRKRIRTSTGGRQVASDVQAAVVANVATSGGRSRSSARTRVSISQSDGRTEVVEHDLDDAHE